jgi:hypothetical protein
MPNPDDDSTNRSHEDESDAPSKAPIDQWLDGDISTTDVIDRFLGFFGINMNTPKRRGKDNDDT